MNLGETGTWDKTKVSSIVNANDYNDLISGHRAPGDHLCHAARVIFSNGHLISPNVH